MDRRISEKERTWRALIQDHSDGNLSVREFCNDHDVSEQSFYRWKRKLKVDTVPAAPFTEIQVVEGEVVDSTPNPIDVVLSNGRSLRVPPRFDEATLIRLVSLLESSRC